MTPTTHLEELSEIARAIRLRPRRVHKFPVAGILGFGSKAVFDVAIRVPTSREIDLALAGAEEYAKQIATKTPDLAKDPVLVDDTRAAFIVAMACRDPKNPDGPPVWPSGSWVKEHLTNDETNALLNLCNEVRALEGSGPKDIADSTIEATVAMCVTAAATDVPEAVLADRSREFLTHAVVLEALKIQDARERAASMVAVWALCTTLDLVRQCG